MPGRHHRNPHFSYGFRPGRSQHDALDALIVGISSRKVNFILDADIRSFFTEVSQEWVVRFLEHRIGDKSIIRLVQKWLRAGIVEDGVVTIEEKGTGQGSVISPLLANVYLHYVFDLWAERWRRREAAGGGAIGRVGGGAGRERPNTARGHLAEFAAGVAPADKTLQATRGKVLERCMEQETSDGQGVPRRLPARREVAIRRSSALLQKLRHSHQT
jgi:retron-type reverse transcriptase